MSLADTRQAIEGRFTTNFSALPIWYDNASFEETDKAHVALFVLHSGGDQVSLGLAPLHRWSGVISVKVMVPEAGGTQTVMTHADAIEAIWRNAEFSTANSGLIRCRTPNTQRVGVINGWYQVNVLTPFIRDRQF